MDLGYRFWSKVDIALGCWTWGSALDEKGYALFWLNGQSRRAHRLAWEEKYGPIPADLTIDHICFTKDCVNTDHMELVTSYENTKRRPNNPGSPGVKKCTHERIAENLYFRSNGKIHDCKLCVKERRARR